MKKLVWMSVLLGLGLTSALAQVVQQRMAGNLPPGENVVGTLQLSGRGKGSGVEVNLRVYPHRKVRDGRVFYSFEYPDRASALEAAGLRE